MAGIPAERPDIVRREEPDPSIPAARISRCRSRWGAMDPVSRRGACPEFIRGGSPGMTAEAVACPVPRPLLAECESLLSFPDGSSNRLVAEIALARTTRLGFHWANSGGEAHERSLAVTVVRARCRLDDGRHGLGRRRACHDLGRLLWSLCGGWSRVRAGDRAPPGHDPRPLHGRLAGGNSH